MTFRKHTPYELGWMAGLRGDDPLCPFEKMTPEWDEFQRALSIAATLYREEGNAIRAYVSNGDLNAMNETLPKLLRSIAAGADAQERKHDVIFGAAADEIERLRAQADNDAQVIGDLLQENERLRAVITRAKDALLDGQLTEWVHDVLVDALCKEMK